MDSTESSNADLIDYLNALDIHRRIKNLAHELDCLLLRVDDDCERFACDLRDASTSADKALKHHTTKLKATEDLLLRQLNAAGIPATELTRKLAMHHLARGNL
tara:strand:+ start:954 stop:1262 length:309 start_codon:yes stop_codon:yes gene_type:complete